MSELSIEKEKKAGIDIVAVQNVIVDSSLRGNDNAETTLNIN